ncbi:MAG: FHA domain-containing protein [Actinomycetota bacterium]|nr:FHA domain-containing protein [Actinomycetota bacterium]MDD5667627.1 FHA domain-containing protein [Actinomycetota bacterium]
MFCTKCGHYNPEGSVFCSRCGAHFEPGEAQGEETTLGLPAVEAEVEDEVEIALPTEPLEEGSAMLMVRKGPDAGMRFVVNRDIIVIGRHPESDIFLDDITVSRRHAEIRREVSGFTLLDTGSLNGTYLNRERIEVSSLSNGDEIQIGKFRLLFLAAAG